MTARDAVPGFGGKFDTSGGKLLYSKNPRKIYAGVCCKRQRRGGFFLRMAPYSAAQNSSGSGNASPLSLLRAKWRHRNWNIERGAGDAHTAFAGRRRKRAAGALTLASGGPKHEAEHAVSGAGAIGRNRFNKIGSGFLIRGVESCAIRMSGDKAIDYRSILLERAEERPSLR